MIPNLNKILKEWSYRVGVIKPRDEKHIYHLNKILTEEGWSYTAIDEIVQNLTEMSVGAMETALIAGSKSRLGKHSTSRRVSNIGNITPAEFIDIIKITFSGVVKVDVLDPGSGDNGSGAFKLFKWTHDNIDYKVHLAGEVTGRGTTKTKDQELSWLLVLSGIQFGGDPTDKEAFISLLISNSEVYGKIAGMTQSKALHLAAYIENNDDWYVSHVKQCKQFMKTGATNQPTKYVKDDSSLAVNKQAKKLYKAEHGKTLDLDKWNPADVWLEYSSIPSFDKLAELNNYLLKSIAHGNGYIGVSLKKGGGKVGIVNGWNQKVYTLDGIKIKYGGLFSQGVTFEYSGLNLNGLGLHFRIFSGKDNETIRGEGIAKGANAVQGKVKMSVINDFKSGTLSKIESVKGASVELSKNIWGWSKNGKQKFNLVSKVYNKIKGASKLASNGSWDVAFTNEKNFLKTLNDYYTKKKPTENSVKANISSRFQSIMLGSIIASLNKSDLEKVMLGMLKYGKSESEWSSAHYKAQ